MSCARADRHRASDAVPKTATRREDVVAEFATTIVSLWSPTSEFSFGHHINKSYRFLAELLSKVAGTTVTSWMQAKASSVVPIGY